jgi:DNA-binding transcriptional MerR regulator
MAHAGTLVTVGGAAYLVAQATGKPCSADTIRYHADLDRLPSQRTASGLRLFRPADVVRFAEELRRERERPSGPG